MIDVRPLALILALTACSQAAENTNAVVVAEVSANAPRNSAQAPAAPSVPTRDSAFTQLDMARCRILEENKEEGPYWLRRCPGHAGWQLDWSDSDLRQGLTLISPQGRETELSLSDLVAKGAFNSLGKTIDWRGANPNKPEALIVRMSVANGVELRLPDISRLAVVRLTQTPCLVAVIEPGAGQNDRAREVADGDMATCVAE